MAQRPAKRDGLEKWGRRVIWNFPIFTCLSRRLAIRALVKHAAFPEAIPHLAAALAARDQKVVAKARDALESLSTPAAADALCGLWARDRNERLAEIVVSGQYMARSPVDVHVLSGLKAGLVAELAGEGAEGVPSIVRALSDTAPVVKANADKVLRSLNKPAAIDALIDLPLSNPKAEKAVQIINETGYRHSVEGRWFLYLVLVGRFDDYLSEDFEFQTLRPEFQAALPELQARIRDAIVQSGDIRMNELFVVHKRETILGDLTDKDAEVLVKINVRNKNWDTLFKYLWVLPARRIAQTVKSMNQAGWRPEDSNRAALFDKLTGLAGQIGAAPQKARGGVQMGPVMEKWLSRGETAGKPETELRDKLKDDVTPPEQLAALSALRKTDRLTDSDLATAAKSPHWPVRMAAASMGQGIQKPNDGAMLWFERLAPVLDADALWGGKPCDVKRRDGLEALQKGLAAMSDRKAGAGLLLVEAVTAHYRAHDIEIEVGVHAVVREDSFEIEG
ncbi:MAG: HEAT repeat domain-containing protein [Proteobacteria bacterium]|nr:HEAT repeat domain-containing protein [Pseudomonadota bacterium]